MGYAADRRGAAPCYGSFLPFHSILRYRRAAPGSSPGAQIPPLLAVDRDALGLALRSFGLGHGDRQHAVLEACLHLVLLDLGAERDAPLEMAIEALAELTILVLALRALLAAQGQDIIVEAGQLGGHTDFLVGLRDLHVRPAPARAARSQAWKSSRAETLEAAEHIVEQPIDLAMQGHERVAVAIKGRRLVFRPAPGNEIFHVHGNLLLKSSFPCSATVAIRRGSHVSARY